MSKIAFYKDIKNALNLSDNDKLLISIREYVNNLDTLPPLSDAVDLIRSLMDKDKEKPSKNTNKMLEKMGFNGDINDLLNQGKKEFDSECKNQ